MPGYINVSGNYRFDDIGLVKVMVRSTTRVLKARWKGGILQVSAPTGIEYDRVHDFLRKHESKIEDIKPSSLYYDGMQMDFGEFTVEITGQHHTPDRIIANFDGKTGRIAVGRAWDIESADAMRVISKFLCNMARYVAQGVLIQRGRQLAAEVGCKPLAWEISNGHRTMGRCSQRGVIALSYALMFYPPHLRDYVIYHELAHLREMNHSAAFHMICNEYCDGREAELELEFKCYRPPIVR